jgi:hypothetical protein
MSNQVPPVALLPNLLVQWKILQPFQKQVNLTPLGGSPAAAVSVGSTIHFGIHGL